MFTLEQLESDAEWAHGQAMRAGDSYTAKLLADISQIVHLQKTLLLRESDFAETVGQCTQQASTQVSQIGRGQGMSHQAQQMGSQSPMTGQY